MCAQNSKGVSDRHTFSLLLPGASWGVKETTVLKTHSWTTDLTLFCGFQNQLRGLLPSLHPVSAAAPIAHNHFHMQGSELGAKATSSLATHIEEDPLMLKWH